MTNQTEQTNLSPSLPIKNDYEELRRQRVAQLDDEMRHIYESALAAPTIRETGVQGMRAAVKRPDAAILAPGVKAWNIDIPGPAGPIPTRIFMPEGGTAPRGVYLSTHGGGWVFNEGLTHIDTVESRNALDWGCAVVHPDFRVAPEHKFPAAVDDCYAAYGYILQHAERLGMDPARIGIGGGCTGANLATVVSLMARDAGEIVPAIQYLWSPACDTRNNYQSHIEFANGYGLRHDDAEFVTENYLGYREDCFDWRASPVLTPSLKHSPPALIWVGEWEILLGETQLYANRLKDAGVKVHYIEGLQQGHGFIYSRNPTTGQPTRYSRETMPKVNAIMRNYIGPPSSSVLTARQS